MPKTSLRRETHFFAETFLLEQIIQARRIGFLEKLLAHRNSVVRAVVNNLVISPTSGFVKGVVNDFSLRGLFLSLVRFRGAAGCLVWVHWGGNRYRMSRRMIFNGAQEQKTFLKYCTMNTIYLVLCERKSGGCLRLR